jgi:Flp pilus assembly protein TadG
MTGRLFSSFRTSSRQQRGIAAVEFALVFGLLFFALYGIVTFGVVLYTQQVVSRSAEDGARAVLRLGQSVQVNDSRVREVIYDALASALITPPEAGTSIVQKKAWLRTQMESRQPPEITRQSAEQILVKVTYPYSANPVLPRVVPWTGSWDALPTHWQSNGRAACLIRRSTMRPNRSTTRHQQRGSVIVIAAIALSLIVIALIGTEIGYLFFMKREYQKAADLAALAGAQKLQSTTATNRCELAAGIATSNASQNLPGIAINTPDCGNWRVGQTSNASLGCFADTDDHFIAGGAPLNAVRIRINQPAPTLLPFFPWARTICVQAVAALDEPQASFSVGSGVARLNEGALNQLLSLLLGTTINLSLIDYTGLANAKVNLLGMVDALDLNVGTIDQLAQTNITLSQLLNAAIEVLPQGNDSQTVSLVAGPAQRTIESDGWPGS